MQSWQDSVRDVFEPMWKQLCNVSFDLNVNLIVACVLVERTNQIREHMQRVTLVEVILVTHVTNQRIKDFLLQQESNCIGSFWKLNENILWIKNLFKVYVLPARCLCQLDD